MRRLYSVLAMLGLLAALAGCQIGKPKPQPSPSQSPLTRQSLAKLLDVDAASTPIGSSVAALPVWQGNAETFADTAGGTLLDIASAPFDQKAIVANPPFPYTASFLRGSNKLPCDGKQVAATDPPVACPGGYQVLITVGYIARYAPTDRIKVLAYLAYAFGNATAARVAALAGPSMTPEKTDLFARCAAGSMIGSLAAANKLGGNAPASDVQTFAASFRDILAPRGLSDTASVRYGVTHTVGACIGKYYLG